MTDVKASPERLVKITQQSLAFTFDKHYVVYIDNKDRLNGGLYVRDDYGALRYLSTIKHEFEVELNSQGKMLQLAITKYAKDKALQAIVSRIEQLIQEFDNTYIIDDITKNDIHTDAFGKERLKSFTFDPLIGFKTGLHGEEGYSSSMMHSNMLELMGTQLKRTTMLAQATVLFDCLRYALNNLGEKDLDY